MDITKQEKLKKIIIYVEDNDISAYEIAKNTKLTEAGIGKILNKVSKNPREMTVDAIYNYLFAKQNNTEPEIMTNSNGNKFVEKEDGSFNVTVKMMPFEAYASHLETLNDANVVHEWEEVTFDVSQYGRGNYMAFRTKGDSMNGGKLNDTPDGSLVLGRELGNHHWQDGFRATDYGWIILSKENIFHKDIVNFDKETGNITCHSRNPSPEYSDFQLNLNDVYQIFKVIKRTF